MTVLCGSEANALWAALMARAREAISAPSQEHLVLYTRVPVQPLAPTLVWSQRLDVPIDEPNPEGSALLIADAIWDQMQRAGVWGDWLEAGWRVAATVRFTERHIAG